MGNSCDEIKYYNAINLTSAFSPMILKKLLENLSGAENLWKAGARELEKAGVSPKIIDRFMARRKEISPEEELERMERENIELLPIFDEKYPVLLKEISDAPASLYVKERIPPDNIGLAMVGSRRVTFYGKNAGGRLAAELASAGLTIISGLALGIDTIAHRAALDARKPTLAVLGSGVDAVSVYPVANRRLSEEIINSGGALVSEYPPGTEPLKYHFPARNRIISGLARGVIVVEAKKKSGALITAGHALEQNREVFAVPGSIFSANSEGTNNLIKMGAKLVTGARDIFEELNLGLPAGCRNRPKITGDTPEEVLLLKFLSAEEPLNIDKLARNSGLDSATTGATLTVMEIKGKIKNLGGMNYILSS